GATADGSMVEPRACGGVRAADHAGDLFSTRLKAVDLARDRLSGNPRRRPGPLKIEAAKPAVDVEHLADEVQVPAFAGFHRRAVDLVQRNAARSGFGVVVATAVAHAERYFAQRPRKPAASVPWKMRHRHRRAEARMVQPDVGNRGRQPRGEEAAERR